jgi:hypothetical protein
MSNAHEIVPLRFGPELPPLAGFTKISTEYLLPPSIEFSYALSLIPVDYAAISVSNAGALDVCSGIFRVGTTRRVINSKFRPSKKSSISNTFEQILGIKEPWLSQIDIERGKSKESKILTSLSCQLVQACGQRHRTRKNPWAFSVYAFHHSEVLV